VVAVVGGGRSESPMEEGTQRWHTVFGGGSDLGVLGSHLDKDDVYWADLAGLVVLEVGVRQVGSDLADGGGVGGAGEKEREKKKKNGTSHVPWKSRVQR